MNKNNTHKQLVLIFFGSIIYLCVIYQINDKQIIRKEGKVPRRKPVLSMSNYVHLYSSYIPPYHCMSLPFKQIYHSCVNKTHWELKSTNMSLQTNLSSTKIEMSTRTENEFSYLNIKTYNNLKQIKTFGGDSWWVQVIGKFSFHIDLIDNADGTYESWLIIPKMNVK